EPRVLHAVAGRVRVHVPGWSGKGKLHLEMELGQIQGVHRIHANPITGNILILFDPTSLNEQAILHTVQTLNLARINDQPIESGEGRPVYPLDPAPLMQGTARALGVALGLGFLVTKRLVGWEGTLPGAGVAAYAAGAIGLMRGFPPIRYEIRRVLGRPVADLLFHMPNIVLLTLSGSSLGLVVAGAESLRQLTEGQARHSAWRHHEERVAQAPSAQRDAIIRLESGERIPLAAKVLEGTGTATGLDGMPLPVYQGALVPPGARLYGGPCVLQL